MILYEWSRCGMTLSHTPPTDVHLRWSQVVTSKAVSNYESWIPSFYHDFSKKLPWFCGFLPWFSCSHDVAFYLLGSHTFSICFHCCDSLNLLFCHVSLLCSDAMLFISGRSFMHLDDVKSIQTDEATFYLVHYLKC